MYDVIIVGGGPAGFSAGIYTCRYMLNTLLMTESVGGQIAESYEVENYPGIKKVSGFELMNNMKEQFENFKGEIKNEPATSIEKKGDHFVVNNNYEAKSLILALGMKRRKLGAKGEEEFMSKGVSYCATCDGAFFKDKTVGVVGGNDSAVEAAILLSQYASKVYIIYRKEKVRAEPFLIAEIEKNPKIEVINNTNIQEIKGDKFVNAVTFDNGEDFQLDGVFIEIGWEPRMELINALELDNENGLIKVKDDTSTNVEGIYSAGDCTTLSNKFNQVITAAGEGAVSANSVYNFLKKKK